MTPSDSMPAPLDAEYFRTRLLDWFDHHGRSQLPWQQERTPYRVWVSEIMLQQTQVATVIDYFQRFMARFPDVESLAAAELDEVLHLWTGLGYYARARNLHRAARCVVEAYGGHFPVENVEALSALPGIGRSTAGAIIAQATGQRAPILDGNVKRVLSRLHGVGGWPGRPAVERRLWQLAEHYTPHWRCADFTQAMMDMGATLCTRRRPACLLCPFVDDCVAHRAGEETRYPESKPKKTTPLRHTLMLMLIDEEGRVLLEQRPASGLWGGLWGLPQFDDETQLRDWLDSHAPGSRFGERRQPFVHAFTHFRLEITPLTAHLSRGSAGVAEGQHWYDPLQPASLGLAAPVKALLDAQTTLL
ncbi:A/G-specific adenine glycosylase [Kushneria aurantia]|uniref:Adenine DNA glycosylase n=1 Tax=Kushneria aurantia TaxID=504092 RepID=A0ABV6G7V7_9GAMM|nr:A/G-specific adenine glycosylase [Kushneria aurantia]